MLSIGWVIGPVVGGYGAQLGGFGAPFFITAGLAFVCYPLLLWLTPKGKPLVLAALLCLLSGAPLFFTATLSFRMFLLAQLCGSDAS